MELINKKKFVKMVFDEESRTFVIFVVALEALLAKIIIYSLKKS